MLLVKLEFFKNKIIILQYHLNLKTGAFSRNELIALEGFLTILID